MTCGIYGIQNIATNELYIGQSIQIETRWKQHINSPAGNVETLINAYNFNKDLIKFRILKEIDSAMYGDEELGFILDIWEEHILDINGGLENDKILNVKKISVRPVPLTILKYNLPEFLDRNQLYSSIKEYFEKENTQIIQKETDFLEEDSVESTLRKIIDDQEQEISYLRESLKYKSEDAARLKDEVNILKDKLDDFTFDFNSNCLDCYDEQHDKYLKHLEIA